MQFIRKIQDSLLTYCRTGIICEVQNLWGATVLQNLFFHSSIAWYKTLAKVRIQKGFSFDDTLIDYTRTAGFYSMQSMHMPIHNNKYVSLKQGWIQTIFWGFLESFKKSIVYWNIQIITNYSNKAAKYSKFTM